MIPMTGRFSRLSVNTQMPDGYPPQKHWAKYVSIEYGKCLRCGRLVFMPVTRGHIARWRHDRNRWKFVWHRPCPTPDLDETADEFCG